MRDVRSVVGMCAPLPSRRKTYPIFDYVHTLLDVRSNVASHSNMTRFRTVRRGRADPRSSESAAGKTGEHEEFIYYDRRVYYSMCVHYLVNQYMALHSPGDGAVIFNMYYPVRFMFVFFNNVARCHRSHTHTHTVQLIV